MLDAAVLVSEMVGAHGGALAIPDTNMVHDAVMVDGVAGLEGRSVLVSKMVRVQGIPPATSATKLAARVGYRWAGSVLV